MSDTKLKITQVRSLIGRPQKHRRIIEALGLKRHQTSPRSAAWCSRYAIS